MALSLSLQNDDILYYSLPAWNWNMSVSWGVKMGRGGLFLSSKCINYKCIHAKKPMHFSFQSSPGQSLKLSQSKKPSRDKDFMHKQRWNSCKCQIPSILVVIKKRNITHCTPALGGMIWMLYLTHISSLSHMHSNFLYLESAGLGWCHPQKTEWNCQYKFKHWIFKPIWTGKIGLNFSQCFIAHIVMKNATL